MISSLDAHHCADTTKSDWASAFCNVEVELNGKRLHPVRGTVPKELNGTLYRNGPGRLERDGHSVRHPFDGDGMVSAWSFKDGTVELSNRFVRTKGWIEEEEAGRYRFRGLFGTQKPGGILANVFDLRLKNVANTNVVKLGDDLLALWEAGSPYALDPVSLETRGVTLLGGALKTSEGFSAHPRVDPGHHDEARMVTFAVTAGPRSRLHLMEFATEGPMKGQLIAERTDWLTGYVFLHDFAITENWAVFFINPVRLRPVPFVLGQKGAAQCLRAIAGGHGRFLLIPRDCGAYAGEAPKLISGPSGYVSHHLNAFEDPVNGEIVVDSIYYKSSPDIGAEPDFRNIDLASIPEGRLRRCRLNPKNNTMDVHWTKEHCCEFAMVNPLYQGRDACFAWMAVSESKQVPSFFQAVEKLNLKTGERTIWSAGPRGFVNEPVMVPMPTTKEASLKEDQGWILVLIWNAERCTTDLVVLDAADMTEQAVIEFSIPIPYGLHGSWVPSNA